MSATSGETGNFGLRRRVGALESGGLAPHSKTQIGVAAASLRRNQKHAR